MMPVIHSYSVVQWLLVLVAAFIIGLSKAGLKGIDMMNVTLMALVFGAKSSTGIVLPLLCIADVIAVIYYHRYARWQHVWKLLPWMVAGILLGVAAGSNVNEHLFRKIMAVIIGVTVVIMVWMEWKKVKVVPENRVFASGLGLVSGFTTMLGNLAGAFSNIYFLAMRMPKNDFIGTAAWVFLIINWFKLPLQIIFWKNISITSLQTDLLLLPAMLLGFWAGLKLVASIKEDGYRKIILVLTLIGAVMIFLKR